MDDHVEEHQRALVTIVLTTLNGARYLRESIDSCLGQTYPNIELIVVDGGSTDGTLEIIGSYADDRMRLVHQANNAGRLPGALNLGLDAATGEYLTWMQDDCVYEPHAIETMVRALEAHPEVGQVCADYWQIDAEGRVVQLINVPEPEDHLKATSDPGGVCFLIRRSVREVVGPHHIDAYPTQDAEYRWRIALQFTSLRISEPLFRWRLHPDCLSGRLRWLDTALNDVRLRRRLGILPRRDARLQSAEFHIAFAFDRYQKGMLREVPGLVCAGLLRNPAYARNRGVWAILFKSLVRHKQKAPVPHAA